MRNLFLIILTSILFVSCKKQESEIGRYQLGAADGYQHFIDTKTGLVYKLYTDWGEWIVLDVVNREYSYVTLTEVEELTSIKPTLQK
jgi:hypothetical protein